MAARRHSLGVGLTVLALAALMGFAGILWLGAGPRLDRLDVEALASWVDDRVRGAGRTEPADVAPAAERPLSTWSESELLLGIERRPKSAQHRYAYAVLLYREGRLDEASEQLSHAFRLNESLSEAGRLHTHINDLLATPDPAERAAKRTRFAVDSPDLAVHELADVALEVEVAPPMEEPGYVPANGESPDWPGGSVEGEREARLRALDARYGISAYPWYWVPSPEEQQRGMLVFRLEMQRKYDEADAMHREQLRAYPDSPDAILAYVVFLINRGRYETANAQLALALGRFSTYPELLIVHDGLSEIRSHRDQMEQSTARARLVATLSDAAFIRMNAASDSVAAK